jgi:hypothetical protein
MKIAISGTYSTGKTTTAIALGLLTGIQTTHARTMREILPTTYPGKRLEKCNFHELMELGMRRFTERVVSEKKQGDCFISDGCPLQEWIYGTTRMLTGLNPSENQWKIKLHKTMYSSEWKIFEETINAFGKVVKEYTKRHYDAFIHLPVEFPFESDGHRPTSELFRHKSEERLLKTYKELDINVFVSSGLLEERLEKIMLRYDLNPVMPVSEAITKTYNIKRTQFDSVLLETA